MQSEQPVEYEVHVFLDKVGGFVGRVGTPAEIDYFNLFPPIN